ncbi:MAG: homoserine dehydrogenase [Anaerolineae bacterium]
MELKIALLGFGNVNRALARLMLRKVEALKAEHDLSLRVVGISTNSHGRCIDPEGIDLAQALEVYASGSLDALHRGAAVADTRAFVAQVPADLVVESTWMDPQTGQPATDLIRAALQRGMHVVTANKGPLAYAHRELRALAREKQLGFFFESTVMDGGPVHAFGREGLPVSTIHRIRGVLNSTTNSILTRLEQGVPFEDALREMQEAGLAEADPTNDIEGWDSALKIVVLANVHMGADLRPADVDRTGIADVTIAQAQAALKDGKRIKLLCEAWREGETVRARVAPTPLPLDNPLAHVMRTSSAVTFEADTLTELTIIEGDSTPDTTAFGVLADIVNIARGRHLA